MTFSQKLCKTNQVIVKSTVVLLLFFSSPAVNAEFNKHEIKIITEAIKTEFDLLIDSWNEELYFEMYDFGQRASQKRLSRGEFAQRMVELKWKPSLKEIKIDEIKILYMNFAVICFWQEFENKVNSLQKVEKYLIFPTILESDKWKFDLTQLIRIPYEGKFKEYQPEKKKENPSSKASTAEMQNAEANPVGEAGENPQ